MKTVKRDLRQTELGLIHQGKKALGLDDATYRALLKRLCNVGTAADLDIAGRVKVIQYFKNNGWEPKAKAPATRRREAAPAKSKTALWSKIDALLYAAGRTRAYLDGTIKTRIAKVEAWEFADEKILQKVIAALAIDSERKGAVK